jgi:ABC-type polysaccharide/polyol phosphate export permease
MWDNLARLLRHRGLVQALVVRDLKARYRGSVLGFFWSFANPLLLLLVYTFVFSVVLDGFRPVDIEPYALFLFCGLLPWTWFSSGLTEAGNSLVVNGNLIKKVVFPAEILPVVAVTSNLCHFVLGLPILFGFLVWYDVPLRVAELIWFPAVVAVQLCLTLGLAMFLAALTVHFRDLKDLLANALTLWFFATPILYEMSAVPEGARALMNLNPFAHLAVSYQQILFHEETFGHWPWLGGLAAVGGGLFLLGYWFFDRLRDSFAEEV